MLGRLAQSLTSPCRHTVVKGLCTLKHLRTFTVRQPAARLSKVILMSDVHARPLPQPRRSLRTRTAVLIKPSSAPASNSPALGSALLSDKIAQSEDLAEPLEQAPAGSAKEPRSRKRKLADTKAVQTEQAAAAATNASDQPSASSNDKAKLPRKPRSQAPAATASVVMSDPELDLSADAQAKAPKQRHNVAKIVVKTESVTAAQDDAEAQDHALSIDTEEPQATTSENVKKQRKPKKSKAVVKTETVTVTETAEDAERPTGAADESEKKKKPRKPRAKATVSVETLLESVDVVPYRERTIPKKWVGAHVSMAGGLEKAVVRAASIGANSFALDTRSKRRWDSPPISVENADNFKKACKDYGFGPEHILPHGSYLINLASADPELLAKSYAAFVDELKRCEAMGIRLYNFHPGSTAGKCPAEEGMARIADSINRAHAETETVIIVLENMAGAGFSVGHKFEYLRYIIDRVVDKPRVGVCLDTCHLFAGGYDVSSSDAFEQTMKEFEEVIGLQYLKGMHVNDSKAALGSKKDRHENVAKGQIGEKCFSFIMNDDRFNGIPLIMETPVQCHGPDLDFKLSLLAGGPVFKGPSEEETGINTDKKDIAYLNSLAQN